MNRIRLHGRGGQGIKTASRVLGTALYLEGLEVQDAPRYGAERRGAPIFAYVRADRRPIRERGVIVAPDLVIVADDTLVGVPTAGVLQGVDAHTVVLIDSAVGPDEWRRRLNIDCPILVLPKPGAGQPVQRISAACAGAGARVTGLVDRDNLIAAVELEYADLDRDEIAANRKIALEAYELMAPHERAATERDPAPTAPQNPNWIDLPFEAADVSAPAIHDSLTSVQVRTGLWRTMRPVIDYDRCRGCWWVCSTFCPDNSISVSADGRPVIDYDTCKGCMICVAQCPPHAIAGIPEADAAHQDERARPVEKGKENQEAAT